VTIQANVSGGQQITATVGETQIDVSVSGGVGPAGPAGSVGPQGPAGPQGAQGPAGAAGTTDYTQLTNVPSTFTPAAHNQAWSTITSTPTTLSGYGITDAVASSDSRLTDARTPTAHVHSGADITSGTVAAARLPVVLEQTHTVGNSGTSTTLALTNGSVQTVTLNGNCAFTMPAAAAGASLTLILTQSSTFTATFTSVLWPGGTAPTITATANKVDILVFVSNGTSWFGTASQNH
jgi:hypothetical protein